MSTNKYYTPEIEEFHIGFEYEYNTDRWMQCLDNTKGSWIKETFYPSCGQDGESELCDVEKLIEEEKLRVKYLDREDIESLGFEAEEPSDSGYSGDYYLIKNAKFKKPTRTEVNELHLIHQPITNWILIWQTMEFITGNHHNVRFSGEIKNKSELKRILKQIGVTN